MNNLDAFRSPDHPKQLEPLDVRKEAENLVKSHQQKLSLLKAASGNPEAFQKAAIKATEQFQHDLKELLKQRNAEALYAEIDASVHAQISRIMADFLVNSPR